MNIPLLIVILYVLLLFGISIYVSYSQKKDSENFLLYKGKNNAFVVAASIAGLAIGGASTIGIAENAFTVGLLAGWYDTAWAIGAVVSSMLAVRYLRRSQYTTISGLVRDLYGTKTKIEEPKIEEFVLKKSFYGCSNYPECKFTLAEHFRKKKLTKTNVKELLEGKETLVKGIKNKEKKPYNAVVKIGEKGYIDFISFSK